MVCLSSVSSFQADKQLDDHMRIKCDWLWAKHLFMYFIYVFIFNSQKFQLCSRWFLLMPANILNSTESTTTSVNTETKNAKTA